MNSSTHLIQQDSVIEQIQGIVYLIGANGEQIVLDESDVLLSGQTIFVTNGSLIEIIDDEGERLVYTATDDTIDQLSNEFDADGMDSINLEEIAQIQDTLLAGDDPNAIDNTAPSVGSAIGSNSLADDLVIVDRVGEEMIPTARYSTTNILSNSVSNTFSNTGNSVDTTSGATITLNAVASTNEGIAIAYSATVNSAPETDLTITLSNGVILTVAAGSTTSSIVEVPVPDDVYIDADYTTDVSIASTSGGGYDALDTSSTTARVVSDDSDTTTLTLNDVTINEDFGTATISATLDFSPETELTVTLSNGATITFGTDYVVGTEVSSSAFVVQGDDVYLDAESYEISVESTTGGNFENLDTSDTAIVSVEDTTTDATVTLSADPTSITEAGGTITYTATLSNASQGTTTVETTLGTITITDGNTTGTLEYEVSADEDVYLDASTLDNAITSATGGNFENLTHTDAVVTTNITDTITEATVKLSADTESMTEAGGTITYTATLSNASQGTTTVETTLGTITITDGNTTGTLEYEVSADEDVYLDASTLDNAITSATGGNFENLTHTDAVVTTNITDTITEATVKLSADTESMTEAGGTITYTATLSNASQGTTTVETTLGTITITDGNTTGTLEYEVFADEDVYLDASTLDNAITSATGGNFENLTHTDAVVTTNITDTIIEATVKLSADTESMTEAGGTITYTATLSNASQGTTMVETTLGTITITDGNTTGTLEYEVFADEDVYLDASTLDNAITSATGGNFENLTHTDAVVTTNITDTINKETITLKATASVDEGDNIEYSASVEHAPQNTDLVITLSNGEVLIIKVGETQSNTVSVNAEVDSTTDTSISVSIDATKTSGGNYEGLDTSSTVSTLVDVQEPPQANDDGYQSIFSESFESTDLGDSRWGEFSASHQWNTNKWSITDVNGDPAELEIQNGNVAGVTGSDGTAHAELDSHGRDNSLVSISTEVSINKASTAHKVSFDYQPRPGSENDSDMQVTFGGISVYVLSSKQGGVTSVGVYSDSDGKNELDADDGVVLTHNSQTGWYSVSLIATSDSDATTTLSFTGLGTANTLGAFLDNINVAEAVYITDEDTDLSVGESHDVLLNDTDPDEGDTENLVVTQVNGQGIDGEIILDSKASVTMDSDGTFVYEPNGQFDYLTEGEIATDTFEYTIKDPSSGGISTATVTVTITGKDDGTVTVDDSITIKEDTKASGNVLTDTNSEDKHDADVDDDLSVTKFTVENDGTTQTNAVDADGTSVVLKDASHNTIGTLTMKADGSYTLEPMDTNTHWSGSVPQITYTTNTNATATLDITVTPIADKPNLSITAEETEIVEITAASFATNGALPEGVTVKAFHQDNTESSVSIVNSTAHGGFGVSGKASGDNAEIGLDSKSGAAEALEVDFGTAVSSVDVAFAWLNSRESAFYELVDANGKVVGSGIVHGGSDKVDPAITLDAAGLSFEKIVFSAPGNGNGDDYLIHSISFTKASENPIAQNSFIVDEGGAVDFNIEATLVDLDKSEALSIRVDDIPEGFTLTDGVNTFTAESGTTTTNVTDWNLNNLSLITTNIVPEDGKTEIDYTLKVVATATESSAASDRTSDNSVDITVTVKDVVGADEKIALEDINAKGNVLSNDTDLTITSFSVEGSNTEYVVSGKHSNHTTIYLNNAAIGVITMQSNGAYVFDPAENWNGDVPTITYTTNTGASETLDITVTPVNDTPSIEVVAKDFTEDTAATKAGALAATYKTTDVEDDAREVDWTAQSGSPEDGNGNDLYELKDNDTVVLTQEGADYVNAGNKLPTIDLTVKETNTDPALSAKASDTPEVTLNNDAPESESFTLNSDSRATTLDFATDNDGSVLDSKENIQDSHVFDEEDKTDIKVEIDSLANVKFGTLMYDSNGDDNYDSVAKEGEEYSTDALQYQLDTNLPNVINISDTSSDSAQLSDWGSVSGKTLSVDYGSDVGSVTITGSRAIKQNNDTSDTNDKAGGLGFGKTGEFKSASDSMTISFADLEPGVCVSSATVTITGMGGYYVDDNQNESQATLKVYDTSGKIISLDNLTVTVSNASGDVSVNTDGDISYASDGQTILVNNSGAAESSSDAYLTQNVYIVAQDNNGTSIEIGEIVLGHNNVKGNEGSFEFGGVEAELTYSDQIEYHAVDNVGTDGKDIDGADSSVLTINTSPTTPANNAPDAIDDQGTDTDAYSVYLGDAAQNRGGDDAWDNNDSTEQSINIHAVNAYGETTALKFDNIVDGNANVLGISGSTRTANQVASQIEFDKATGDSETVIFDFNGNVTDAEFTVSHLISNEGGNEQGQWTAYYQGAVVAIGTFDADTGNVTIGASETGNKVFDSLSVEAIEYKNPSDNTQDSSDFYITGLSATGAGIYNSEFTTQENVSLTVKADNDSGLLVNDTDSDGDTLTVYSIKATSADPDTGEIASAILPQPTSATDITPATITSATITLASGASVTVYSDGSYDYDPKDAHQALSAGEVATETFKYTISDGDGGFDTATVSINIIGVNNDLTFTSESAGFQNIVGYYEVDPSTDAVIDTEIVIHDQNLLHGKSGLHLSDMNPNSEYVFFVIPDGAKTIDSDSAITIDTSSGKPVLSIGNEEYTGRIYYDDPAFNLDGEDHFIFTSDGNGGTEIKLEDLSLGDADFTDVVMYTNFELSNKIDIDASLANDSNTGSKDDTTTDIDTPVITGNTESGAHVVITDENGNTVGEGDADKYGDYSIEVDALSVGNHKLTVTAENANGDDAIVEQDVTIAASSSITVETELTTESLLDYYVGVANNTASGSTSAALNAQNGDNHTAGTLTYGNINNSKINLDGSDDVVIITQNSNRAEVTLGNGDDTIVFVNKNPGNNAHIKGEGGNDILVLPNTASYYRFVGNTDPNAVEFSGQIKMSSNGKNFNQSFNISGFECIVFGDGKSIGNSDLLNADMLSISGSTTDVEAGQEVAITLTDAKNGSYNTTTEVQSDGSYSIDVNISGLDASSIKTQVEVTDSDSNVISDYDYELDSDSVFRGDPTDNTLDGSSTDDVLKGYAGNDSLNGRDGDDTLIGGSGNDILDGGAGNDVLIGGTGQDIFKWTSDALDAYTTQSDTVKGFTVDQGDKLDISDLLVDYKDDSLDNDLTHYVTINSENGDTTVTVDTNAAIDGGDIVSITLQGIDHLQGFNGNAQYSSDELAKLLEDNNINIDG